MEAIRYKECMPGRNVEKVYAADSYYHVYSRGVNKREIFLDDTDYAVFLNLFKRYLSSKPVKDNKGREYPWFGGTLDLIAFCLMPNHVHMFIYQRDPDAMAYLMKSVMSTYSMYFNKRYKRIGPLFQSRYRAVRVVNNAYFQHITRYIHLNPKDYKLWQYSSYQFYSGLRHAEWVKPEAVMGMFSSPKDYQDFVGDYQEHKKYLDILKEGLA